MGTFFLPNSSRFWPVLCSYLRTEDTQMPEKQTLRGARKDKAEGKAPSTQAGEFVREEIDHIREGKHGARSAKQALGIGLSKTRRAGVNLPPPAQSTTSQETRQSAARALQNAGTHHKTSA